MFLTNHSPIYIPSSCPGGPEKQAERGEEHLSAKTSPAVAQESLAPGTGLGGQEGGPCLQLRGKSRNEHLGVHPWGSG